MTIAAMISVQELLSPHLMKVTGNVSELLAKEVDCERGCHVSTHD